MNDAHKQDIELGDNRPPRWILVMWVMFGLWALVYLSLFWLPDMRTWTTTENPDTAQWHDYR